MTPSPLPPDHTLSLTQPERFVKLGIDPPKGVLLFGPPGTGKTLLARAVANRTDACFIRVIGSELVQKYVGEGARMVRELFEMARSKKACIMFFDEIDAIGGLSLSLCSVCGGGVVHVWSVCLMREWVRSVLVRLFHWSVPSRTSLTPSTL